MDSGIIAAVGSRDAVSIPSQARVVDFGDSILTPGLIDIHVHGGAGHDVMEGSDESLAAIERLMVRHGVTSYCPTTVTAPLEQTLKSLEDLARAAERADGDTGRDPTRAQPLGIHLEGPFLSHARRGVHPGIHLQRSRARLSTRCGTQPQAASGCSPLRPSWRVRLLSSPMPRVAECVSALGTPMPLWSRGSPAYKPEPDTLRTPSTPCAGSIIAIPDCWARFSSIAG